ncbi:MAG TPA: RNA polymerase sigma factor [Steroidobacteraceae bacterium]|nr:RNA polymerase sigma factor [Steroidobacteraceae bacterium]
METRSASIPLAATSREQAGLAPLLHRARANDREAFRGLVEACQARVYTVALRLTGQRADAEELAQDVFVQLHASLWRIEDANHLQKWLLRAIYHRSIDRLRQRERQGQRLPLEVLGDSPEGHAPDAGADPMAASRLYQLLLQLQPDARAVVLLRYQDDQDPVDIAAALDMPVNTVKSHLRRSLQWLRDQYAGDAHGY